MCLGLLQTIEPHVGLCYQRWSRGLFDQDPHRLAYHKLPSTGPAVEAWSGHPCMLTLYEPAQGEAA